MDQVTWPKEAFNPSQSRDFGENTKKDSTETTNLLGSEALSFADWFSVGDALFRCC